MIKKKLLKEETISQAVDKAQAGSTATVTSSEKGELESLLDELLQANLEAFYTGDHNFVNLLVVGVGGTGKTSRIRAWAKKHNLNLVTQLASIMDDADLSGVPYAGPQDKAARRLATTEFDTLDKPDSVLFLDEFNRGRASVRGTLLTLIQEHLIPDARLPEKVRFLPNLLFTIAAVNPATTDYNTDPLDDAELSRFVVFKEEGNNKLVYLNYILDTLKKRKQSLLQASNLRSDFNVEGAIKALDRRADLISHLVKDSRFTFDNDQNITDSHNSGNGLILSFRTLTNALLLSNGTKEDFLNKYRMAANDTRFETVNEILANYKDKDDKANDALKKHQTQDQVFRSETPQKKRIASMIADLNNI